MGALALADVYAAEFALLRPYRAFTARGLKVNDALRRERLGLLAEEATRLEREAQPAVEALRPKLKRPGLFFRTKVCKACRNGSRKRLGCKACGSAGKFESFRFNLGSEQQLKDVLYGALRLPRRQRKGKVTTDEEALQSLLALDKSGLVALALRYAKFATMGELYARLAPGVDGRVRSVFNPAGTYTGRPSSAEAFYVPSSTNLLNLPAQEAKRDPLFRVREVIVPEPGEVFLYADLSQAEARVVACLSEDDALLERWADPRFDIHVWTARAIFPGKAIGETERFLGKKARHALNYGMGANKFWREVNAVADLTGVALTLAQAAEIRAAYLALHPNLDAIWWNRVERQLYETGAITTCWGRRCNFYPRKDFATGQLDPETLRAAVACEPQSTVADLLNRGLLRLWQQEKGNGFRLLLNAYDAVLLGVDKHRVRSVARLAKAALEEEIVVNGRKLLIPAEVFVGERNWSELERVV